MLVLSAFPMLAAALDPPLHAQQVGHWDGHPGAYADVWAEGVYAYLVNWGALDKLDARVFVIDLSDPAQPVLDETLFIPAPNEGASGQDVKAGDGLLFVGLDDDPTDGAAIFDIGDPADRHFLTWVTVPGFEEIHNLYYDAGFLYLPSGTQVAIVDLRGLDRVNPPAVVTQALWILDVPETNFVHDVTVLDGRLWVAAWHGGIVLYDVSDVANTPPVPAAQVLGTSTHSTWATGDGRFALTAEERFGGGITAFEIVEAAGVVTLELRDTGTLSVWSVHNSMTNGLRVFNSWKQIGLQVFDISPVDGSLEHVASFDTSDAGAGAFGVYSRLGDDRVLVSDAQEGLFVIEVDESIVPPPPPVPIPALAPWATVVAGVCLLAAGLFRIRAPTPGMNSAPSWVHSAPQ